jgi:hypothetical protein
MNTTSKVSSGRLGIRKLIQKYRTEFRQPENIDFYSEQDYRRAERKFIKLCLMGKIET